MDDGTCFRDEEGPHGGICLVVAFIMVSVVSIVTGMGIELYRSRGVAHRYTESLLIQSYQENKPFVYYNGKPIMVGATIRSDGSTLYWGVSK